MADVRKAVGRPLDCARKFEDYGVESIIYTDIGRDGMLQGINIDATVRLARAVKIPIVGQGGIETVNDALEFFLAGATAISIGTANFTDPRIPVRITGELRVEALRHALRQVVQRHEQLRTVFGDSDGEPMQAVRSRLDIDLPVIEVAAASAERRLQKARELASEEGAREFDPDSQAATEIARLFSAIERSVKAIQGGTSAASTMHRRAA